MTLEYTPAEELKLAKKRKNNLPSYYNLATKEDTFITRDFESWLILEKSNTKDKIWNTLREQDKESDEETKLPDLQKEMYTCLKTAFSKKETVGENYLDIKSSIDERWNVVPELSGFLLEQLRQKYTNKDFENYDWLYRIATFLQPKDKTDYTKQNESFKKIIREYDVTSNS